VTGLPYPVLLYKTVRYRTFFHYVLRNEEKNLVTQQIFHNLPYLTDPNMNHNFHILKSKLNHMYNSSFSVPVRSGTFFYIQN
jgi:hypothetical protein